MLFTFATACGRSKAPSEESRVATSSVAWTRAEWLQAVDGFIANPATMPRLGDPTSGAVFDKLVSTDAWLKFDGTDFKEHGEELIRFFPAFKKLAILMSKTTVNELVALNLYGLDVYRSFINAGIAFIEQLPDDSTREARLHGINTVRLGAAMEVVALLYIAVDASDRYRATVIAKLTDAASYSYHSREGLQLILATLDEKLLPTVQPKLRESYSKIRAVVAQEYGSRSETPGLTRTTYQGLGPPSLSFTKPSTPQTTVVSITGRYSVGLSSGTAKRVEEVQSNGMIGVQHWIEWQDGETKFESVCIDGTPESTLAAGFQGFEGLVARESQHPGKWFTMNANGREGHYRILTIGGRGCIATVEGPSGQVPSARAEAFLLSIKPVT